MKKLSNKLENKRLKIKSKTEIAKIKAKEPVELTKEKQKTARHVTWATAFGNALGKASQVGNNAVSSNRQNISGGLTNTANHRDDDDDYVDEGGIVY